MKQNYNWEKAFEEAYNGNKKLLDKHLKDAYDNILMPFISLKSQSKRDAEEISSQAITKFWERFFVLREPLPDNVNGYLYTIGLNTYFYHYKMKNKVKKQEVILDMNDLSQVFVNQIANDSDLELKQEKEKLYEAIERGLAKMCQTCKDIIRMNVFERKKLKDFYSKLGLPSSNAASKKKVKCINKLIGYAYKELHT